MRRDHGGVNETKPQGVLIGVFFPEMMIWGFPV